MKWLKAFRAWMRVVLPFEWAVLVWLAAQFVVYAMVLWAFAFDSTKQAIENLSGTTLVSGVFAGLYGVYRVWYFHPIEHRTYGEWLQKVPWTPSDPLPLGPLNFVWQDLIVLLVLGLANPSPVITLGVVIAGFIFGYCGVQAIFAILRQEPWGAYSFVFLFGVGIIGFRSIELPIATALGMCVFAHISNSQLLARVKHLDLSRDTTNQVSSPYITLMRTPPEGWPAGFLCRDEDIKAVPQRHALGIGLAVSWITYAILWHFPLDLIESTDQIAARAIAGVPFVFVYIVLPRLLLYCWNHRPPISIFGRVTSGRLIIPGYDKVFVFALIAVIGWLATLQLVLLGFDIRVTIALSAGFLAWAVLGIGPSLRNWHLTGHHRIIPGLRTKQKFESL